MVTTTFHFWNITVHHWKIKDYLQLSCWLDSGWKINCQHQPHKQVKQKHYFYRQTKEQPELQAGEKVRIQRGETWQPAVVLKKHEQPRSSVISIPDGKLYRRSINHLRKAEEKTFPSSEEQDTYLKLDKNLWHKRQSCTKNTLIREHRSERSARRPNWSFHISDQIW